MKQSRVKVNAHVIGVGFYSYMVATVFGNTTESMDEVIGPHFFIVSTQPLGLSQALSLQFL